MFKIKNWLIIGVLIGLAFIPQGNTIASDQFQQASPDAVIQAINAYRSSYGLYTYATNSILTQSAQAQANYMASTKLISHTGANGTKPIDRAYSLNYGNGKKIFISEIIYGSYRSDLTQAVTWWKNSSIHNDQMLATTYLDIGAGVASNGDWTYYVAVMGWITDSPGPVYPTAIPESQQSSDPSVPQPTATNVPFTWFAAPVSPVTPQSDGAIVHTVLNGQTLWTISAVYDVPLDEIRALNNLNVWQWLSPGDELIIRIAFTPSPTATPLTPVIGEALAQEITATSSPTNLASAPTATEPSLAVEIEEEDNSPRWIIIIGFIALFSTIAVSIFWQKEPIRPPQKEDY